MLDGRGDVYEDVLVLAAGIWNGDRTDVEHSPVGRASPRGVIDKRAFHPTRRRSRHFNDVESTGHRDRANVQPQSRLLNLCTRDSAQAGQVEPDIRVARLACGGP